MMMLSTRSPKHSRRHIAKLTSMSNSFDMSDNSMQSNALLSASKAISMPNNNNNTNNNEDEMYEIGHESSENFLDEATFTNANFDSNMSFGQFNASATSNKTNVNNVTLTNSNNNTLISSGRKEKNNISGKIYKKHHTGESQSFLPKPDTSTLIKNIDKKLSSDNMVPILIVSKGRKFMKNKVSQLNKSSDSINNNNSESRDSSKKKHYESTYNA